MKTLISLLAAASLAPQIAHADMFITEWLYSGSDGEFIEFTNLGASAIDLTGWSYDDDSAIPGIFDLTGFGVVASGESVIITESDAGDFRNAWSLDAAVKVLGGVANNLGRNDQINLFDSLGNRMDWLTYGDQTFPGTLRTQNISGIPGAVAALGAHDVSQWHFSVLGDGEGTYASAGGDLGNPGMTSLPAVPEPETYALMLAGLGLVGYVARRRSRT